MNKTYYAIKHVDTGKYWSFMLGNFANSFWPGDLTDDYQLISNMYGDMLAYSSDHIVIESFIIQSTGIVK